MLGKLFFFYFVLLSNFYLALINSRQKLFTDVSGILGELQLAFICFMVGQG